MAAAAGTTPREAALAQCLRERLAAGEGLVAFSHEDLPYFPSHCPPPSLTPFPSLPFRAPAFVPEELTEPTQPHEQLPSPPHSPNTLAQTHPALHNPTHPQYRPNQKQVPSTLPTAVVPPAQLSLSLFLFPLSFSLSPFDPYISQCSLATLFQTV